MIRIACKYFNHVRNIDEWNQEETKMKSEWKSGYSITRIHILKTQSLWPMDNWNGRRQPNQPLIPLLKVFWKLGFGHFEILPSFQMLLRNRDGLGTVDGLRKVDGLRTVDGRCSGIYLTASLTFNGGTIWRRAVTLLNSIYKSRRLGSLWIKNIQGYCILPTCTIRSWVAISRPNWYFVYPSGIIRPTSIKMRWCSHSLVYCNQAFPVDFSPPSALSPSILIFVLCMGLSSFSKPI